MTRLAMAQAVTKVRELLQKDDGAELDWNALTYYGGLVNAKEWRSGVDVVHIGALQKEAILF
jgi:threonine aldolase